MFTLLYYNDKAKLTCSTKLNIQQSLAIKYIQFVMLTFNQASEVFNDDGTNNNDE